MTKRWNRKPNGWKASTSRCGCAAGIDNAEGKQRIVVELYEKFFRVGFPRTAKALGIVYTPTQIEFWEKPWRWDHIHQLWVQAGQPAGGGGAAASLAWERFVRAANAA